MTAPNGTHQEKLYLNGPDQVIPADDYWCWTADHRVKIRMGSRGLTAKPPISVPGLLNRTVAKYPHTAALVTKDSKGSWRSITYKTYQERVRTCAKAFLKLGLERFRSVGIIGFNSEPWFLSYLGAIHAGGFAAGIYTTNSADACFYCLLSSRANICVVQDKKQLEKVLSVKDKLPDLKAIVQWEGPIDTSIPNLYSWESLLEIGAKEPDTELNYILKTMAANECCTLVYTSGTVGPPKAVMLSHDNLVFDALAIKDRVYLLDPGNEILISYLPLSHVAAQLVDIYLGIMNAATVFFAQPDALKGSLIDTLRDVRPTIFLGVPRVWEKMYEKMLAVGAANSSMKKSIASWAKGKSLEYHTARMNGTYTEQPSVLNFSTKDTIKYWYEGMSCGFRVARSLIFSKVREGLGLSRCKLLVTAAAPLSADVKKYFLSLDLPIMDAYGMSEGSGAHALSCYPKLNLDSAGEILNGVETMFGGADSPDGPGEIMMRGRHVFMGYLNDEEKTKAAINEDGWLLSGDVGRSDAQNFLYITGRIKELIITAGGENVAPVLIEQAICSELMYVGYAVVIGDRRKFLSVLLTLRAKVDPNTGEPLDALEPGTQQWVASLGSTATTISEIVKTKDPKVYKAIEAGLARANKQAISNAQKVQKFALLSSDFSQPTGELGPTLKVKKNVVNEKYKDVIEDFYKD